MAGASLSLDSRQSARVWAPVAGVSPAEAELVEALKRGEDQAYEILLSRYEQPVYQLIYRLLPGPGDAADVVQDAFVKVFRSIGSFRGESTLKTWIYRIAVNEAHNRRRWFRRTRSREVGLDDELSVGVRWEQRLEDQRENPFQSASDAETRLLVEQALQRLKPIFRDVVVLRDIEELAYEEIARILKLNLGTVKSRIVRGRDALRRELEFRMGTPGAGWTLRTAEDGRRA